jgi:potassium efflux system protein
MATAQASETLDANQKTATLALYQQAIQTLGHRAESLRRVEEHRRLAADAPGLLAAIRDELSQAPREPRPEPPPGATLAQLEQLLAKAESDAAAGRTDAEQLRAETGRRVERRAVLTDQARLTRRRIQEALDAAGSTSAAPEDSPELLGARRVGAIVQRLALEAELAAQEAELVSYDARAELLPARRDRALRRQSEGEQLAQAWQRLAAEQRRLEADEALREAERSRRAAARQSPTLRQLAVENEELAAVRSGSDDLTSKLEEAAHQLKEERHRLAQVRSSFEATRRKLEIASLTAAVGLIVRRELEALPRAGSLRRQSAEREQVIAEAQFRLILIEEQRETAGDVERSLGKLLESSPPQPEDARAELERAARELLTSRRELLDAVIVDRTLYLNRMVELDTTSRALLAESDAYRDFLEERIFWVRSVSGSLTPSLSDTASAGRWLLGPSRLGGAFQGLGRDLRAHPLESLGVALGFLALIALAVWSRRRLEVSATLQLQDTLLALLFTGILASPIPAIVALFGWRMRELEDAFSIALGSGLVTMAVPTWGLAFIWHAARGRGLGTQFRWAPRAMRSVRKHLMWFSPLKVTAVFVAATLDRQEHSAWTESLGRSAFLVGLIALSVFNQRVLRPGGPVLAGHLRRAQGGWLNRLRYLWYPAAVGGPLVLGILALRGYYYTAIHLEQLLGLSLALLIGMALVHGLLLRWLQRVRNRIQGSEGRESAASHSPSAEAEDPPEIAPTEAHPEIPPSAPQLTPPVTDETLPQVSAEHELDLPAIDEQTQRLFCALVALVVLLGLWGIWADALPALRRLNQVQIWPAVAILAEPASGIAPRLAPYELQPAAPAAGSEAAPPPVSEAPSSVPLGQLLPVDGAAPVTSITLADLGVALLLFLFTAIAARNLPGLLEIILLNRLPVDAGARYAVMALLRYAVLIVGISAGLGTIGISWASIQWLAAALTFGLAFGLQDIFANFASGVIILFERMVRVGDTVTLGGVTGTVSRIRMRATTVTDWDRKELIIPNREFVTGKVVNWSLSDDILRVIIKVGIAYGSDVVRARELLLEAARGQAHVLSEPPPRALFLGFQDNALSFELRVFIPDINHWLSTQDELHEAIDARLRAAGITIAFPQRDLHLRSAAPELLRQLRSDGDGHAAPTARPANEGEASD